MRVMRSGSRSGRFMLLPDWINGGGGEQEEEISDT
jgi:hypothetical protein